MLWPDRRASSANLGDYDEASKDDDLSAFSLIEIISQLSRS